MGEGLDLAEAEDAAYGFGGETAGFFLGGETFFSSSSSSSLDNRAAGFLRFRECADVCLRRGASSSEMSGA
jgi:hypothetical protein